MCSIEVFFFTLHLIYKKDNIIKNTIQFCFYSSYIPQNTHILSENLVHRRLSTVTSRRPVNNPVPLVLQQILGGVRLYGNVLFTFGLVSRNWIRSIVECPVDNVFFSLVPCFYLYCDKQNIRLVSYFNNNRT